MPSKKQSVSRTQPSLPNVPPPEMGAVRKSKPKPRAKPAQQNRGGELLIVDNSDENWKVVDYLREWTGISSQFDIATGYFEIGALLDIDPQWQNLDKIRILMGDEVSRRTKQAYIEGLQIICKRLDDSLEAEKEKNDFLEGVPAIVDAIRSEKIETRVYRKRKFHAKAYITHSRLTVVGSAALVGSSNFTFPGINQNVELNVQLRREVDALQEWYEKHWLEAEPVSPEILQTVEKHILEYPPFEVYARAMMAYFQSHEVSVSEWERTQSVLYPVLDQYQKEGYHRLMEIARRYRGALLCDGVGLGKTYIGLMVIERLLHERKKVALFVPKAARMDVWEKRLNLYIPKASGEYSNLRIYNHTDILRGGNYPKTMEEITSEADALVVDEAHHFRNIGTQRARQFFEITDGKELFLLTATPINNSLYDLMHLIEYFSRRQPDYFRDAPLGIHTLRGQFRKMEDALDSLTGHSNITDIDPGAATEILSKDDLFKAWVVQRSRAYVKESLKQEGNGRKVLFPVREDPRVAAYSLKKTYGKLLGQITTAFNKKDPLITLPIYFPLNYLLSKKTEVDSFEQGRQAQVVGLIRTLLLKRFESSAVSFQASCEDLLIKLLAFVELHNPKTAKSWKDKHADLLGRIHAHLHHRNQEGETEEDLDEDIIPEELKQKIEILDSTKYNVDAIIIDSLNDMEQLASFLEELRDFKPAQDDKLQTLVRILKNNPILSKHKVLIFTEYQTTARYLEEQLTAYGIGPLMEVDSQRNNASEAIHIFSPYYNESNSHLLKDEGIEEIRVLVSTDILAEGLNLQDATCIINYDLHWNPVRMMQRIGRVDRRLEPSIENRIVADHPELKDIRGTVCLWNFLPPDELNEILSLYERVTQKALRISKTFGIEGRKFLTPDDDFEALREFNQKYEGTTTSSEEMYLAYQRLLLTYPDLPSRLPYYPKRLFSGKESIKPDTRGVFFCYQLPSKNADGNWDLEASFTRWYYYDLASDQILEDAAQIFIFVQCDSETPRVVKESKARLSEIRHKLDEYILDSYLKKVQAPIGFQPALLAWMELN